MHSFLSKMTEWSKAHARSKLVLLKSTDLPDKAEMKKQQRNTIKNLLYSKATELWLPTRELPAFQSEESSWKTESLHSGINLQNPLEPAKVRHFMPTNPK